MKKFWLNFIFIVSFFVCSWLIFIPFYRAKRIKTGLIFLTVIYVPIILFSDYYNNFAYQLGTWISPGTIGLSVIYLKLFGNISPGIMLAILLQIIAYEKAKQYLKESL